MSFPSLTFEEFEEGGLDEYDFYLIHNNFTARIEAGWVNDPHDKGGETLFGISRKANQDWPVWALVDSIAEHYPKGSTRFKQKVESNKEFFLSAARIFFADYYLPVHADETQQEMAMVMYDLAVHAGVKRSVKMAQRTINKMHGGTLLIEDGRLGALTRKELVKLPSIQVETFAKEYLRLRLAWHIKANPEYTKGFTRRVHDLWRFIFEDEM